jgi:hypothetical protein
MRFRKEKSFIPLVPEWDCLVTYKGEISKLRTSNRALRPLIRRAVPLAPFFIPENAIGMHPMPLLAIRGNFAEHVANKETPTSGWVDAAPACHKIGEMARNLFRMLPWKVRAQMDSELRYATLEL